jgi:hypothetical protein
MNYNVANDTTKMPNCIFEIYKKINPQNSYVFIKIILFVAYFVQTEKYR